MYRKITKFQVLTGKLKRYLRWHALLAIDPKWNDEAVLIPKNLKAQR